MTVMIAVSSLGMMAASAKEDIDLYVNDAQMTVDAFEEDGNVMVPVRVVCEALDMLVSWNGEAKRVEITAEGTPLYVTFTPFEDGYTFARTAPQLLGVAPQLLGEGITYVPAKFFGEIIPGATWEKTEKGIEITYVAETEDIPVTDVVIEEIPAVKALVTDVTEEGIMVYDPARGEVKVNISEETEISEEDKAALASGKMVEVVYGPAMTMSLPPMTTATSVKVLESEDYELIETTVQGIEEGGILVGETDKVEDLTLLVKTEDFTALDAEGNAIEEIKEGSKITAIVSTISTRSLPPQKNVFFIRVVE